MKRLDFWLVTLVSVCALAASVRAGAQDRTVVNCSAASLKRAVNRAAEGEKIIVRGTCAEEVVVKTDRIQIIGRNGATIQPPAEGIGITVLADGVVIKNLVIIGGAVGIDIAAGASAQIKGNQIMDYTNAGIEIRANSNGLIDSNTLSNGSTNLAAINLVSSASAQLVGNTIDHVSGGYGVNIASTSSAFLACNTISVSHPFFAGVSVSRTAQLGFAPDCPNTIANNDAVGKAIFCSQTSSIFAGADQNLTGTVDLAPNCEVVTLANVTFPPIN